MANTNMTDMKSVLSDILNTKSHIIQMFWFKAHIPWVYGFSPMSPPGSRWAAQQLMEQGAPGLREWESV